jgi:hypothetical protein
MEEIPTDITPKEQKILANKENTVPSLSYDLEAETSAIRLQSVIDLMKDFSTPTKMIGSKAHNLLMPDMGLSNYPDAEYAEMMNKFYKSAGYFLSLGYTQIAATIIFDRQGIMWFLQGVDFGLRKQQTTQRAEIVRKDQQTPEQKQGGISFNPKKYMQ